MNKIPISFFFLPLLICSGAFALSDTTFSLSGKITGYGDGIITINYSNPNERVKPDTIKVINDSFRMTGSMSSPMMAFLKIMGNENLEKKFYRIDFILDNSNVNIKANVQNIDQYQLTGSKVTEKYKYLSRAGYALRSDLVEAIKNTGKTSSTGMNDAHEKIIIEKREKYLSFLLGQEDFANCDACVYTLFLMNRYIPWSRMEKILPLFDRKIHDNVYYKYLDKIVSGASRIQPGSQAANFKVQNLNGKEFTLNDFRGNFLLLAFSASWCHPCKFEYPFLRQAYDSFHDKGLNVLIINLDEEKENWTKDVKEYHFPFPVLSDGKAFKGTITRNYGVFSIPKIFLISPEGRIISNSIRGKGIIEALNKIYGSD